MPHSKKWKLEIPLCKTCANAYTSKYPNVKIIIADYAKGCLAHWVDLDTVGCIEIIPNAVQNNSH